MSEWIAEISKQNGIIEETSPMIWYERSTVTHEATFHR